MIPLPPQPPNPSLTVADSNHTLYFPLIQTQTLLPHPQPLHLLLRLELFLLSPSSTIFTVSLSGSVVETCRSGLPKGRTLARPFTLCPNQRNTKTLTGKKMRD